MNTHEGEPVDLNEYIGAGRVNIHRTLGGEPSVLRDVEVLEASPGRARLDEPRPGGHTLSDRGTGWIDTTTVTRVEVRDG